MSDPTPRDDGDDVMAIPPGHRVVGYTHGVADFVPNESTAIDLRSASAEEINAALRKWRGWKLAFDTISDRDDWTTTKQPTWAAGGKLKPKPKAIEEFEREVTHLINRLSLENGCDMPDYTIARYLRRAYENLCAASADYVHWKCSDWEGMHGD